MHQTAVIILCVLIAYFVWRDLVEVFVAWYSGAEPPLTVRTKAWIWSRTAIALAAAAAAVATL
jgi:hypothetical protein